MTIRTEGNNHEAICDVCDEYVGEFHTVRAAGRAIRAHRLRTGCVQKSRAASREGDALRAKREKWRQNRYG